MQGFFLGFLEKWKIGFLDFSLVDFLVTPIFFKAKWEKLKNLVINESLYNTRNYVYPRLQNVN
jgi:hypothetical protein